MDYSEIKRQALAYSDRESDAQLLLAIDGMLRIVEARINRLARTRKRAIRSSIGLQDGVAYYALPPDFDGLRDIEIVLQGEDNVVTLGYLTPEQMNINTGTPSYTVIADQLHIKGFEDASTLEIVYYRNLLPLGEVHKTNWMSEDFPDIYLSGMMVEISAFVKSPDLVSMWDIKFNAAVRELIEADAVTRWSGTPLTIKAG